MFGLSLYYDGDNLPRSGAPWMPYEVIPMALNRLGKYSLTPDKVVSDLLMHGFHLAPVSGNIMPFPSRWPRK